MFELTFTESALEDLRYFRKAEQNRILAFAICEEARFNSDSHPAGDRNLRGGDGKAAFA